MRLFQASALCIFLVFMGLMFFVATVAYSRPSGRAFLAMEKVNQIRFGRGG